MIEAVFFDVGNTLMRDDPSVPYLFTSVARNLGHDVDVQDAISFMPEVGRFYEQQYLIDGDFWCNHDRAVQLWLDMYTMIAHACGIEHDIPELAQAVYDAYLDPANWSMFPDADKCIKQLKSTGLRLAIVSNWDATLENLIRSMGKLPYFDEVIASAAVGCRKPSTAIFEIALERMDVSPERVVHVGDLPEADGAGASSAGITPVIIDRVGRFPDCAYARVESLTELPALIEEMN